MTHYLEDFGDLHLPATFRHRNIHQEVTSTGKCLGIITDTETGVLDPGPLPPHCLNLPRIGAQMLEHSTIPRIGAQEALILLELSNEERMKNSLLLQ